jgi:hypothetical protein
VEGVDGALALGADAHELVDAALDVGLDPLELGVVGADLAGRRVDAREVVAQRVRMMK